jgi:hypothetical protein
MKWKCKQSGNIMETHTEHDAEIMKGHDGYELVVETEEVKEQPKTVKPKKDQQ